jgi:tRNA(fMet)-specific endonuclease VapC
MNGRFLLDTNVLIALLRCEPRTLVKIEGAEEVYLPSIVLGELYYGARKSKRIEENLLRLTHLAAQSAMLPCDEGTAVRYGEIKDDLRRQGRPIPENDLWIAAIAVQHGLTLVTSDSHFEVVAGLAVESW